MENRIPGFALLRHNTDNHNLKEKQFNLTHSLKDLSLFLVSFKAETAQQKSMLGQRCAAHGNREAQEESSAREEGVRDQGHAPHRHVQTCALLIP